MNVGRTIKKARDVNEWSQAELADKLKANQSTVHYLEKRPNMPPEKTFKKLAKVLKTSTNKLILKSFEPGDFTDELAARKLLRSLIKLVK